MNRKISILVLTLILFSIGIGFGDTITGISDSPYYYFDGNEYEPITVYEVEDMDGYVNHLILLRDLSRLGYTLKWNAVDRTIEIIHALGLENSKSSAVTIGTQIMHSDIKAKYYDLELIDIYVANGMTFINIERLPYAYYNYLPDKWARPYINTMSAAGYFKSTQNAFNALITAGDLSVTLANILGTESNTFDALVALGLFNGVAVQDTTYLTRDDLLIIEHNLLNLLEVDTNAVESNPNTNYLSIQEAIVLLCKTLETYHVINPFEPYTEERMDLNDLNIVNGIYETNGFEKPLILSSSAPKLTLYNAFLKSANGVISLEIDQDYAPMGGIYSILTLHPQITQMDVVLKSGEIITKNMGRMPNYSYLGSGIFRTSIQINPPVQGMNESTVTIDLKSIDHLILHAPNNVLLKISM